MLLYVPCQKKYDIHALFPCPKLHITDDKLRGSNAFGENGEKALGKRIRGMYDITHHA